MTRAYRLNVKFYKVGGSFAAPGICTPQ